MCVFFDMLCIEDQDVQFTCKVRTLLGGEDSLLWSSAQELKFQVRVRFPSKEQRNLCHIIQVLLACQLQKNIVFTRDMGISDKRAISLIDRERKRLRQRLLLFMPFPPLKYCLIKAM